MSARISLSLSAHAETQNPRTDTIRIVCTPSPRCIPTQVSARPPGLRIPNDTAVPACRSACTCCPFCLTKVCLRTRDRERRAALTLFIPRAPPARSRLYAGSPESRTRPSSLACSKQSWCSSRGTCRWPGVVCMLYACVKTGQKARAHSPSQRRPEHAAPAPFSVPPSSNARSLPLLAGNRNESKRSPQRQAQSPKSYRSHSALANCAHLHTRNLLATSEPSGIRFGLCVGP